MAGAKRITQLTADTAPTATDKIVTVDVETGTTKSTTLAAVAGILLPTGLILPYGGSTAPTGWLLCQGQAISRTTYAALFAIIGTAYGVGDGSTTFNVPDMQGRIPVGLNTSGSDFNTLGKSGGSKYIQQHTHAPHTWGLHVSTGGNTGIGNLSAGNAHTSFNAQPDDSGVLRKTSGVQDAATGTSGNLQPYNTFNYTIKT